MFLSYEHDHFDSLSGMERQICEMQFSFLFDGRFNFDGLHNVREMAGSIATVKPSGIGRVSRAICSSARCFAARAAATSASVISAIRMIFWAEASMICWIHVYSSV